MLHLIITFITTIFLYHLLLKWSLKNLFILKDIIEENKKLKEHKFSNNTQKIKEINRLEVKIDKLEQKNVDLDAHIFNLEKENKKLLKIIETLNKECNIRKIEIIKLRKKKYF